MNPVTMEMTVQTESTNWVIDQALLAEAMDLDPKEGAQFDRSSKEVLEALLQLTPPERIEVDDAGASPSAGANLLIPRTRYHLNVSAATKATLLAALQLLAKAIILDRAKLIETGLTFTATGIHAVLTSLTRLSDPQLATITGALNVVRAAKLPNYRPSTREIAKQLGRKPAEVETILKPLINKAVNYDEATKTWSVMF